MKTFHPKVAVPQIRHLESYGYLLVKSGCQTQVVRNYMETISTLELTYKQKIGSPDTVSYTHLTLPTIYSV